MREHLTTVTRKGQITLPADVRRALGVKEGDKVAVSVSDSDSGQATVRPIHSVTDLTFGAITPRKRPEDIVELRRAFMDHVAENALREGNERGDD
jgi:AbrB family looped-hinge helix DNA binding protein